MAFLFSTTNNSKSNPKKKNETFQVSNKQILQELLSHSTFLNKYFYFPSNFTFLTQNKGKEKDREHSKEGYYAKLIV